MGMVGLLLVLGVWGGVPAGAAEKLSLMLDWYPNVDHLPIFVAQQRGFFEEEGIKVDIVTPSDNADPLKLAAAGHADLALGYQPQLVVAVAAGLPVRAVGRLIGAPLATVLYLKDQGIHSPQDLEGRDVGYTVPGMMDVLLDVFCRHEGLADVHAVSTGFSIVQALVSGQVAAVCGGYRNYEFTELELKGYHPGFFPLEDFGVPDYDELVVLAGEAVLEQRREVVERFVRALDRALETVRRDPEGSLAEYFKALPEAPRDLERRVFERTRSAYASNQHLDPARWQRFSDFALEKGLIARPVSADALLAAF